MSTLAHKWEPLQYGFPAKNVRGAHVCPTCGLYRVLAKTTKMTERSVYHLILDRHGLDRWRDHSIRFFYSAYLHVDPKTYRVKAALSASYKIKHKSCIIQLPDLEDDDDYGDEDDDD